MQLVGLEFYWFKTIKWTWIIKTNDGLNRGSVCRKSLVDHPIVRKVGVIIEFTQRTICE